MSAVCPSCGEENPSRARFCLACGSALPAQGPSAETRRRVTILFTDVTGSTGMGEQLDPETLRRVMSRYFEAVRAAIERHGGTVEKFIGDAVMAVFGIPRLHEDDALRAARAAIDARDALGELNRQLEAERGIRVATRTGINTGDVVTSADPGAGDTLVTGDAVNVAARLEQAASPGEILVGDATAQLIRHAASLERVQELALKGKSAPVVAHRLLQIRPTEQAQPRHLDAPMVGRERELRVLTDALERARADRACHLVTVLGSAGVGKSRLVVELEGRLPPGTTVIRGRCLSYGDGITYWPLVEALRSAAGLDEGLSVEERRGRLAALVDGEPQAEAIVERVSALIGLGGEPGSATEAFWGVRRLLEAQARRGSLVVIFEDVHWATPTFLDLVEHVAEWTRDAPILLVCLARPELLDQRPGWGGGKLNATSFLLEPLGAAEVERLLDHLLAARTAGADDVRQRIREAAEGNPLFVEELVAMLETEGQAAVARVPPSIEALMAARIDQLPPAERMVLERASVIGRQFGAAEVAGLATDVEQASTREALQTLVRRELLRPDPDAFGTAPDDEPYRFRHQLIRDAAYAALSKESRAGLHERYAGALEARPGAELPQLDELVGYHLAEAHRYRSELGGDPEGTLQLAQRAAAHLGAAGTRAVDSRDMGAGTSLLQRAVGLLSSADPGRLRLLPLLARALMERGELDPAATALEEAGEAPDLATRAMAEEARLNLLMMRGVPLAPCVAQLEEIRRLAEASRDHEAAVHALIGLREYAFHQGALTAAVELGQQAIEQAAASGKLALQVRANHMQAAIDLFGSAPVSEVERRMAERERFIDEHGLVLEAAWMLGGKAGIAAYSGRFDEARRLMAEHRARLREFGLRLWAAVTSQMEARVEQLAGDIAAAERILREGYDALVEMGERGYLSTVATMRADVLARLDRVAEAEEMLAAAEAAGAEDDVSTQQGLSIARSRVALRRGDAASAERLAHEAIGMADATEFYGERIESRFALAEALAVLGRIDEATAALAEVGGLAERKEDLATASRADAALRELATAGGGRARVPD